MVVLAGHRAHLSYMAKLHFDDTDYSVVVKNRGVPPKSWRWEIYRAGRSNPIGQSPVFFTPWRPPTKQERRHSSSCWPSSTPSDCFQQDQR